MVFAHRVDSAAWAWRYQVVELLPAVPDVPAAGVAVAGTLATSEAVRIYGRRPAESPRCAAGGRNRA